MEYTYDLISGNVHEVLYQRGEADQYTHRYMYHADNKIAKHVYHNNSFLNTDLLKSTYYLRDASGNVMAVYELTSTPANPNNNTLGETSMKVTERHIYGSSRLGMDVQSVELIDQQGPPLDTSQFRILVLKQYEISNHLGNVLSVISDVKLPVALTQNNSTTTVGYKAVVISATDYSPFGVGLYERSWSAPGYRYGFIRLKTFNSCMRVLFHHLRITAGSSGCHAPMEGDPDSWSKTQYAVNSVSFTGYADSKLQNGTYKGQAILNGIRQLSDQTIGGSIGINGCTRESAEPSEGYDFILKTNSTAPMNKIQPKGASQFAINLPKSKKK
jgi:hypothetical protein